MKQEHLNIPFTIVVVCLAIIGLTGKNRLKKQRFDKALIAMLALLAIHYMLIVGTQVDHAWGYGQYTARYILPALLPVALVTAFGFYATRRLLPYVVTGFILVTSMQALWQISDRLATRQPEIYGGMNWVEVIKLSIQNNGVPLVLAGLLLTVIASGIAAYFWSILSVNDSSKRRV